MSDNEKEYCENDVNNITNLIQDKVKKDMCLNMIIDLLYQGLKLNSRKDCLILDAYYLKEECLVYLLKEFDEKRFNMIYDMKKSLNEED